ncbi:MAG TPA: helix-turn-helix domain-containing protein [Solirubrobacterales bacterium]
MALKEKIRPGTEGVVDQRLVKALAHPLRARILAILNERVASPKELAQTLDRPLSTVSYHVQVLKKYECIELVKKLPRRGAIEHWYRGTTRSFLSDTNWSELSPDVKTGISQAGIKMIVDRAVAALEAGTFDSRPDRHLSFTPIVLDEEGWEGLATILADTLEGVLELQAQSAGRLAEAREQGTSGTVAILSFESPERYVDRSPVG